MCPIHLVEPPEQIFCSAVDVVAARIVGEVVAEWTSCEFGFEEIDLVFPVNIVHQVRKRVHVPCSGTE